MLRYHLLIKSSLVYLIIHWVSITPTSTTSIWRCLISIEITLSIFRLVFSWLWLLLLLSHTCITTQILIIVMVWLFIIVLWWRCVLVRTTTTTTPWGVTAIAFEFTWMGRLALFARRQIMLLLLSIWLSAQVGILTLLGEQVFLLFFSAVTTPSTTTLIRIWLIWILNLIHIIIVSIVNSIFIVIWVLARWFASRTQALSPWRIYFFTADSNESILVVYFITADFFLTN